MNWTKSTLGAITEWLKTGKTPPTKEEKYFNGSVKWYTPGDLDKGKYLGQSKRTISVKAFKDKKAVNILPNCLLVTCIGDIAKLGITTDECSSNQQITAFKPKDFVDVKFLYYWFSKNKGFLQNCANNAVVPIINNGTLTKLPFSYPPLETQKKIAEILDTADTLRQKDKALIEKYNQLTQSLFLEMFGDPVKNEKGFCEGTIRDLVSEVKYGTSAKSEEGGAFPYLRMNNISYDGYINLESLKYINLPDADKPKYLVKKGDVLFNRTNSKELVGKTGIWNSDDIAAIAGYLIRVRVNDKANPYFIWGYLNSKHGKKTLENMCKNIVGMANINAQELQNIRIHLPPIDLQSKFASMVEEIEKQKQLAEENLKKSETLFNSLLQRAFKGELV